MYKAGHSNKSDLIGGPQTSTYRTLTKLFWYASHAVVYNKNTNAIIVEAWAESA